MSLLTDTQSISKRLTRYKILRELGRGASGKVYLAEDPFAKRQVAIKVLFTEGSQASAEDAALYKSMFINEASLAGKLVHPHITQILDAVVEDSFSYIVMEYVEGGTLEQYTQPNNLLQAGQVVEIIFKSVRALAYAHSLGLTHRDIKPGNILLSSGTNIKIADFGAAINRISDKTVVTQVGSPAYMAPELISGAAQASHRTDIYSLGVVMFYLLAGRLPFQATNPASLTYMMVNTDPEPPSSVRMGVAKDLDDIVMKAMARNPAERYQAWEDFGLALTDIWAKELSSQEERDESDSARFAVLKTLPFFKGFPENELWEVLRISKWRKLSAGTVIIKEGDRGDSFFVLAGGYCKVTRGNKTLSALAAGDCLGEMAYLGQKEERSATVTSTSECMVMKIRAEDLTHATPLCKHHFDRQFLRVLVSRLDQANQQISVLS